MADGDQRRITKMAQARISRFTINLQTKKLDLDSEVVIFNYDLQIWSCCHQGGGMAFDSEGNLYVTVGDDNSSQSTNGYSGNYQPQRCPTGDPTQATNTHCGANNVAFNDARRTAGNTNNYNGKMLRFNPIDNLADGAKPAVGRRHARTRCRPRLAQRAEPVRRHRGRRRQGQARDLRHGPAQPVAHDDRPRDRRPVRRVGRPGRRLAVGDAGSVDV